MGKILGKIVMEIKSKKPAVNLDVDLSKIKSPVLLRLVEEVTNNQSSTIMAFDRVHNRHNRSGSGGGGGYGW